MSTRMETKRSLDAPYVTRALRVPAPQLITDDHHGSGYRLTLPPPAATTASPAAQLEIYPQTQSLILRTPLFTLSCIDVSVTRRTGNQLTFTASAGLRRLSLSVSRTGTIGVHYSDQSPQETFWQQDVFPWDDLPTDAAPPPQPIEREPLEGSQPPRRLPFSPANT